MPQTEPTGYSANTVSDIVRDAGIMRINGATFGLTKGGLKFDPGWEIRNIGEGLDGIDAPIYLLDRKFYGKSRFSGTICELGPAATGNQIAKLEAGSSSADSGSTPNTKTTITPRVGRTMFVAADYLSDVYLISTRGIAIATGVKAFPSIHFAKALVVKWDFQTNDRDPAAISFEIESRKDMSAGTTADAPFDIVYWETYP